MRNSVSYYSLFFTMVGAMILAVSICRYYKSLIYMKNQAYEKKLFTSPYYSASFLMMVFFLLGYIGIFVVFYMKTNCNLADLLISLIFFFGAIFVLVMIVVQHKMSVTINKKSIETIKALVGAIDAKDEYTKGHSEHVYRIVQLFYAYLPADIKGEINYLRLLDASLLHDVGKIGIPDEVLNKPGMLTKEEREIINRHPGNGKKLLKNTAYKEITPWILYHHERIDGKGYHGLKGAEIPIEAKIISIADIFSALYSDRVYRKKFSFKKTIEIIKESAGTQLDSDLVDVFLKIDQEELDGIGMVVKAK